MVAPPNTIASLSHAMVVQAMPGALTIGAINEWNPKINRTLTDLYEFGPVHTTYAEFSGEPFEVVPGNVSGLQIDVRRWDCYSDQLETAFGTPDLTMLSKQVDAISVRDVWTTPQHLNDFSRIYRGCWWQDIGQTIDAKGDRTINVGGTLRFTHRERVPG